MPTPPADLSAVVARVRREGNWARRSDIEAVCDAASECAELRARLAARVTERDAAEQGSSEWVDLYQQEKAECERLRERLEESCEAGNEAALSASRLHRERDEARAELAEVREDRDSLSRALCDLNDASVALEREHEALKAQLLAATRGW